MVPLWLAATCLTIASPSPVPPVARERALSTRKNRSNTRSWCSRAMPMPRSVTAISMLLPRRRRLIDTGDPWGEYAIAFDTRLAIAVTSSG